jgi:beta-lactamase class A
VTPARFRLSALGLAAALSACRTPAPPATAMQEFRQGGYRFINPLLECEDDDMRQSSEIRSFEADLQKHVDALLKSGRATHVSVYYRDMKNGPWLGVNENELFTPASLLKVPLMVAVFMTADRDRRALEKPILVPADMRDTNNVAVYKPAESLARGRTYTTDEVVRHMIRFSDNDSAVLLLQNVDWKVLERTYKDLDVNIPDVANPENFMTLKAYASVFRVLYNATYLPKDLSERALDLLTQTDFRRGLSAGVPEGVLVAHKFGTAFYKTSPQGTTKQLHDCGIVYHPTHPYLVGVMTRGKDYEDLAGVVSGISRFVYDRVDEASRRGRKNR